jgi:hypothetical protein
MTKPINRKRWIWPAAAVAALGGAAALFGPNLALDHASLTTLPPETARPPADRDAANTATVDLAGHEVPVLEGGLFDRFRSNPPLSVVQSARPELDLSWFEGITKEKKEVGFTTYSPNFYYDNSSITAIFSADMARIEGLIPQEVRDVVEPITFAPGKGLVAITSYAYHYCDNDSYNELSISVVTTRPDQNNWGLISLMGQLKDQSLWGYVLKLPVDTELARVRGVVGYNLPKWKIPIDYSAEGETMAFTYYDEAGNVDFTMTGKKLDTSGSTPAVSRVNFVNLNAQGLATHGFSDVRAVERASSRAGEDVTLALTDGPLSSFIRSLALDKLVRYDYQPMFQAALYTPEPL